VKSLYRINIYMKAKPYVYKAINPKTGDFYYGSRWANVKLKISAEKDLGHTYFSSSKIIKENKNLFIFEVIKEFETKEDAYKFEQELIKNSWDHPKLLNKHYDTGESMRFFTYERTNHHKKHLSDINSCTWEEKLGEERAKIAKINLSKRVKGINNPQYKRKGRSMSEWFDEKSIINHKKAMSKRHSGKGNIHAQKYIITDTNGTEYIIHGELQNFCNKHDLPFSVLYKASTQNGIVPDISSKARFKSEEAKLKRKRAVGWKITKHPEE